MKKYKVRVNRQHGDKLAVPKYHFLLHLVDDIYRFGAPRNTNSGVGEANHKHNVKTAARRTQRIVDLLDQQTGTRTILQLALRLGYEEVNQKCQLRSGKKIAERT